MQIKKCSKCQNKKTIKDFYSNKNNGSILGIHSWCKECQRKVNKEKYYKRKKENPQSIKDYAKKWRSNNLERARELSRESWQRQRIKVLKHYSRGEPICNCCDETEIKFLSIDHINGGGLKESRERGYGRSGLVRWIIRNDYPRGFQILCHNCNFSKGHYGGCPHKNNLKTNKN